jgi:ABC-2 type transport system permease protein
MEIDSGFAERLRNGQGATVQVLADCSNSNTALVALGYFNQIGAQFSRDYQLDRMQRTAPQLISSLPQVTWRFGHGSTRGWKANGISFPESSATSC